MSNLIIATPELSDNAAALIASDETVVAPVAHLQRMQPADVWQSGNLSPYLEGNLGSMVGINTLMLLYTNLTDAATWRVRLADAQANLISSPSYDSTAIPFYNPADVSAVKKHGLMFFAVSKNCQWFRIDLDDPSNPDGYIYAGRLYVSNSYQPTNNFNFGNTRGFNDTSTKSKTIRGNTIVNEQAILKTLRINITSESEAEMYTGAFNIFQTRGGSKDIAIMLDPEDSAHINDKLYYGLLTTGIPIVNPDFDQYEQPYELEELI